MTVLQPFATLIADGEKLCENRRWCMYHRGLLAIHAGKDRKTYDYDIGDWYADHPKRELHFGGVVAIVNVLGCYTPENMELLIGEHKHIEGPWCIHVEVVRKLWLPWKGAQGLWDLPDSALVGAV